MTTLLRLTRRHKALANPVRVRILAMLQGGELCVCQITRVLELAPSTVSRHLAELKAARLLAERRTGRWVHYRLSDTPGSVDIADRACAAVSDDPQIRQDSAVLEELRKVPVEVLCRNDRQRQSPIHSKKEPRPRRAKPHG